MEIITVQDKSFKPYISEEDLQLSVQSVADQINNDYKGSEPLFLGVLNGSFMFFSDLLKSIGLECQVSFVKLSSYEGTKTTGKVDELIGLTESIEGRDVIIIEDIVDTGNTLERLHKILSKGNAKSLKIATLLHKPSVYKKEYLIDYIGIEIPNRFVLGYGLDYNGLGRNLSSIYVLNE